MNVRALDPVEHDLVTAADHLNAAWRGTGDRFVLAYEEAYENIARFPQMYALVEDEVPGHEVRNALLERYDYRVVYLVHPDEAVILAVAHTSRRPGHWHRRLGDESLP